MEYQYWSLIQFKLRREGERKDGKERTGRTVNVWRWAVSACSLVEVKVLSVGSNTPLVNALSTAVEGNHCEVVGVGYWACWLVCWSCCGKACEGGDESSFGVHFDGGVL